VPRSAQRGASRAGRYRRAPRSRAEAEAVGRAPLAPTLRRCGIEVGQEPLRKSAARRAAESIILASATHGGIGGCASHTTRRVRRPRRGAAAPGRRWERVPARVAGRRGAPYAIVDIGSNSVRLVVYDQLGRAPFPRFNEKSLCRLGAGLAETGALAADGFRRTGESTRRFRAIAEAMGVTRIDALATEATRRASNGGRLVAAIAREAGLKVRILSGREEAYYGALGVISGFYRPRGLVGDFGGGSLEIAEARDDRVGERSVSMPIGSLPVEAMMERSTDAARAEIDALLAERLPAALAQPVFYAVGGGWRALARMHMARVGAPVTVAHGYAVAAAALRAFAKRLWHRPPAKLAATPGVPLRRLPTLPAAALVMDRVLKRL